MQAKLPGAARGTVGRFYGEIILFCDNVHIAETGDINRMQGEQTLEGKIHECQKEQIHKHQGVSIGPKYLKAHSDSHHRALHFFMER